MDPNSSSQSSHFENNYAWVDRGIYKYMQNVIGESRVNNIELKMEILIFLISLEFTN